MNSGPAGMTTFELRDYLQILRRRKWVVMVAVVVVTAVGLTISFLQEEVYRAEGQLLLDEASAEQGELETAIRLFDSESVRVRAEELLPGASPVRVSRVGGSRLLQVRASSRSPEHAARSVTAAVEAFIDYRREQRLDALAAAARETQAKVEEINQELDAVEAELAADLEEVDETEERQRQALEDEARAKRNALVAELVLLQSQLRDAQVSGELGPAGPTVVTPPEVPGSAALPDPMSDGLTAFGIGLLLGVALAFLFEYVDDTIKSQEDLERVLGDEVPVIGVIPAVTAWKDRSRPMVVSIEKPSSPAAEAYRSLRTSLQFAQLDRPFSRLAVTSPNSGEGKTTTVANLAVLLTDAGRSVAAVSGDLRHPRLHDFFEVANDRGITSVMIGEISLSQAIQPLPRFGNMPVLPSGPPQPNPSEMLSSSRFRSVIEGLTAIASEVIIDCPPLLPVTDAAVIAGTVDSVLLVVSAGVSTRKQVRRAVATLRQVDAPIVGAVINQVRSDEVGGYGGYESTHVPPTRRDRRHPDDSSASLVDNGDGRDSHETPAVVRGDAGATDHGAT